MYLISSEQAVNKRHNQGIHAKFKKKLTNSLCSEILKQNEKYFLNTILYLVVSN